LSIPRNKKLKKNSNPNLKNINMFNEDQERVANMDYKAIHNMTFQVPLTGLHIVVVL